MHNCFIHLLGGICHQIHKLPLPAGRAGHPPARSLPSGTGQGCGSWVKKAQIRHPPPFPSLTPAPLTLIKTQGKGRGLEAGKWSPSMFRELHVNIRCIHLPKKRNLTSQSACYVPDISCYMFALYQNPTRRVFHGGKNCPRTQ